jgi:hypothetical protein
MTFGVVDTNVAIVANGHDTHVGERCQLACVRCLQELVRRGVIVLDRLGLIFEEYRTYLRPSGQPGVGDAFLRHLFDHQYDPAKCELVEVTPLVGCARGFQEFPDDQALADFDPSDRKFVAVARASLRNPVIFNATDSDWGEFEEILTRHGVQVEQLCPFEIRKG